MAGVGAAHQREALSGALAREFALASGSSDPVSVRAVRGPGANSSPLCVDWQIAARTGLRTRDIAPALAGLLRSNDGVAGREAVPCYDLALVALGVNDATALQSASAFRRDVQALRILLREKHGIGRILWSGLPPIHRFPALPQPLRAVLGRKARELDAVLREWGADYVAMPARLDDAWIADDGFHPGPLAYAAWAAQLRRPLHDAMVQVIGSRELSV